MTIRTKLLLMGAVMAILVGVICAIGYHESKTALEESTSAEITATVDVEAATLNGWLLEKKQQAQSAADLLTAMDGNPMQGDHSLLSLASSDKEVIEFSRGSEDGTFLCWVDGDIT